MLGHGVGRRARHGGEAGHRRRVDDVARALLFHDGQERPDAVDDAVQVDADHPLPQLHRVAPRVTESEDPGVVAQHVSRPEPLEREIGQFGDGGFRRGVADRRGDMGTGLGQVGLDVTQLRRVDVGQHDAHAFGDEPFGERQPDPRGSSRDHSDVAGRDHGHGPNLERAVPWSAVWPIGTCGPHCGSGRSR